MADLPPSAPPGPPPRARLDTIDVLRGMTILWVTALHFYVDTRGVPGIGVASASAWWLAVRAGDTAEAVAVVVRSLVGLPGFRLDLLLFVTALVSSLGRPLAPETFYGRRARSILPHYWLGTLGILLLAAACAAWRSGVTGTPWLEELSAGSRLALAPYRIEALDLLRSLSVVGRLQDARTMQVVAPSLWYVVLVAQLLLALPWLQRLETAWGSARLVVMAAAITVAGRALVFAAPPLPTFDANATVICFLPFRLIGPALGLAAGRLLARGADAPIPPWMPRGAAGVGLALCGVVAASWAGIGMNTPGTVAGVIGPIVPLLLAVPGLWWVASTCSRHAALGRPLSWAGRQSLSLLVVQDALRLIVGTLVSLGALSGTTTFLLLPAYIAVAMALARLWAPWPDRVADAIGWAQARPRPVPTRLTPWQGSPSGPHTTA